MHFACTVSLLLTLLFSGVADNFVVALSLKSICGNAQLKSGLHVRRKYKHKKTAGNEATTHKHEKPERSFTR